METIDIKWTHLEQTLNDFADTFIQIARDHLQENGSIASSNLYNSIEKIVEIGDDYYRVSIQLEDYWTYVENGRSAGKFPPPPKIQEWIEIKPVEPYPDENGHIPSVEQLTFLIGRKIAQEGTDPKPFFEPAKEEVLEKFELAISLAIQEDVDEWLNENLENLLEQYFGKF